MAIKGEGPAGIGTDQAGNNQYNLVLGTQGTSYHNLMAGRVRDSNLIAGPELLNLLYLKALLRLLCLSCSFTSTV